MNKAIKQLKYCIFCNSFIGYLFELIIKDLKTKYEAYPIKLETIFIKVIRL